MIFKIPVHWEMYGTIEVEADSLNDAIEKFDQREGSNDDYSLPEGDYINGSFSREDEEVCKLNNGIED